MILLKRVILPREVVQKQGLWALRSSEVWRMRSVKPEVVMNEKPEVMNAKCEVMNANNRNEIRKKPSDPIVKR
jgi:hypothetical protein